MKMIGLVERGKLLVARKRCAAVNLADWDSKLTKTDKKGKIGVAEGLSSQ
jgi:hypothetical protein